MYNNRKKKFYNAKSIEPLSYNTRITFTLKQATDITYIHIDAES